MHEANDNLAADGLQTGRAVAVRADADGRIVAAVGACESLLGLSAEALAGRQLHDLLDERGRMSVTAALSATAADEAASEFEVELDHAGQPVQTYWRVRAEGDASLLAFAADVTSERKRLGALRRLIDNLPVLVAYVGRDKQFRFCNSAYRDRFGLAADEVRGRPVHEVLGERAFAMIEADMDRALAGEYVQHEQTLPVPERRPLRARTEYMPDVRNGGDVRGFYVVAEDLTEYRSTIDLMRAAHRVTARQDAGVDEMIQELLELGARHFGLPVGIVGAVTGRSLRLEYVTPAEAALTPGRVYALERLCCAETVRGDDVVDFHDGPAHGSCRHPAHGDEPPGTYIGVPLFVRGRTYGVVCFSSDQARAEPFGDIDRELARLLAGAISGLVARAQYESQLEEANRRLLIEASTDPLTGLYSRRFIDEILAHEAEIASRHNRDLVVAMIDLDRFKAINDRHGHETGDAVLQAIAHEFTKELRQSDVLARYGGEEFVVMLPETSLAVAAHVCERLRARIEALEIELLPETHVSVTASFGLAEFRGGDDARAMLRRADRALYRAKRGGRNCVVSG